MDSNTKVPVQCEDQCEAAVTFDLRAYGLDPLTGVPAQNTELHWANPGWLVGDTQVTVQCVDQCEAAVYGHDTFDPIEHGLDPLMVPVQCVDQCEAAVVYGHDTFDPIAHGLDPFMVPRESTDDLFGTYECHHLGPSGL